MGAVAAAGTASSVGASVASLVGSVEKIFGGGGQQSAAKESAENSRTDNIAALAAAGDKDALAQLACIAGMGSYANWNCGIAGNDANVVAYAKGKYQAIVGGGAPGSGTTLSVLGIAPGSSASSGLLTIVLLLAVVIGATYLLFRKK